MANGHVASRGPRRTSPVPGPSACMDRPTSARGVTLLRKADDLLSGAAGADNPAERFRLAYLAALRGAGAVVAAAEMRSGVVRRPVTRNAWALMARADDSFAVWADYFADRSATRAAIEAGVVRAVGVEEAGSFYDEVGHFLHDVEGYLHADAETEVGVGG
ncbi:SAV_6107 family HEPN domain-containing protein [Rhodococcus sp. CH91]|uniref:SAV_6107 family HEPN domain-containing protein n=1 Tax=Rhodococcus sp. CH91 TaxID=2910256 RepID=UPI001F4B4342|nr:SAV_6107 family HEPN domain-containing protein [Rhodococcus sp. CH91]